VTVGTVLGVDDELRSESRTVVVELRCGTGTRVLLSGTFRVLVQPARSSEAEPGQPGAECVFRLSSGAVDVQADQPTEMDVGEATLGSRRTQYGVRIGGRRTASPYRVVVYEGDVTVRTGTGGPQRVRAGGAVAMTGGRLVPAEVSLPDLRLTADAFSQMDVAQVRLAPDSARAARSRLQQEYLAVLSAPAEPQRRVQLAALQLQLQVPASASLYHLKRVPTADRSSRATVSYLTGIAYARTGDTALAGRELRAAAETDSAAVEQVIRTYRLDAATYRAILRARPTMIRRDTTPGEPPLRRE
jgi:hypothetical protein